VTYTTSFATFLAHAAVEVLFNNAAPAPEPAAPEPAAPTCPAVFVVSGEDYLKHLGALLLAVLVLILFLRVPMQSYKKAADKAARRQKRVSRELFFDLN
jgi:hypothetical protein